jgi:hypothetical protein
MRGVILEFSAHILLKVLRGVIVIGGKLVGGIRLPVQDDVLNVLFVGAEVGWKVPAGLRLAIAPPAWRCP